MLTIESLFAFLDDDLGVDLDGIGPETPLFSGQIIDSFALITLMMFIEREAGIRIPPSDVTLDNLDTAERILAYVNRVAA